MPSPFAPAPARRSLSFVGLSLTLAGASSACGQVTNGDAASVSVDGACQQFAAAHADFVRRCSGYEEDTRSVEASCRGLLTLPGASASPAAVDACTKEVSTTTDCDRTPICLGHGPTRFFPNDDGSGLLATGDACLANRQCASGLCSNGGSPSCGSCKARRFVGDACSDATDECTGSEASEGYPTRCIDGQCRLEGKVVGEACMNYGRECQGMLFCAVSAEGELDGVCAPRRTAGQPCTGQESCSAGLYCGGDKRCVAYLADGASCTTDQRCSGECVDGRCTRRAETGLVAEGSSCVESDCLPGLYCDEAKVCRAPRRDQALGQACGEEALCGGGLVCSCGRSRDCNGTCISARPGDACVTTSASSIPACAPGAYCACEPGALCVGGVAYDGPSKCKKYGDAGEACPCFDHLACVDGRCEPFSASICR